MLRLKINSITSTIALAAISFATLTSSGGNNFNPHLFDSPKIAIHEPFINNSNSSNSLVTSLNSSLLSYGKDVKKSNILNEDISNEIFGEMRYLTPEENTKKLNMYRKISTVVEGVSFFD